MIFIRRVRRHSTVCTVSKTAQYSLYCKQVTSGKEQHPQMKKEIQHHLWQCNCISIVASGTNWDATYSSLICMRINPWTKLLPMWHNALVTKNVLLTKCNSRKTVQPMEKMQHVQTWKHKMQTNDKCNGKPMHDTQNCIRLELGP